MTTGKAVGILTLLGLAVVALLLWMPPEQTLGAVIRPVFLHGALVRVGLLTFAAAGVLGLVYLLRPGGKWLAWCTATQEVAVAVWIVYALSSAVTTKLAWGQWIAWEEPRVRASLNVLWFSIAALLLVRWVGSGLFTALANVAVAVVTWMLIRGAGIIRHPFDPIGTSGSQLYGLIYWLLVLVIAAMAAVAVLWLHGLASTRAGLAGHGQPEAGSHSAAG